MRRPSQKHKARDERGRPLEFDKQGRGSQRHQLGGVGGAGRGGARGDHVRVRVSQRVGKHWGQPRAPVHEAFVVKHAVARRADLDAGYFAVPEYFVVVYL